MTEGSLDDEGTDPGDGVDDDSVDDTTEAIEPEQSPSKPANQLSNILNQIELTECEELTLLGVYSIHEHKSSRSITLPQGADGFSDVSAVKQYVFESDNQPFLIIGPLDI